MTEQHYIITWEGYPVMSVSSMADAQEMILTIAEKAAYEDFCFRVFSCNETPEQYVNWQAFHRDNDSYKWWDASSASELNWYGYTLLRKSEDYRIAPVMHLK